jgi:hypothetical protein
MGNVTVMQILNSEEQLKEYKLGLGFRNENAIVDGSKQIAAWHKLHNDVDTRRRFHYITNIDDIRLPSKQYIKRYVHVGHA